MPASTPAQPPSAGQPTRSPHSPAAKARAATGMTPVATPAVAASTRTTP